MIYRFFKIPHTHQEYLTRRTKNIHGAKYVRLSCLYFALLFSVVATYREPVRGWIDNVYGPTGVVVGAGTGVLHTMFCDLNAVTDIIPVDIAVNALICATKETATKRKFEEIPIYTCSSSRQKPITWNDFIELNKQYGFKNPASRSLWYYSFMPTKNQYVYAFLNFWLHIVLGHVLDTLAICFGQKPMLVKMYKKIGQLYEVLVYFTNRQWTFVNDNVVTLWDGLDSRDKELFFFDVNQMSWEYFFEAHCLGLRIYLLKDDIHTLPAAKKKWKRLQIAHYTLLACFYALLIYCAWSIINLILTVIGFKR